MKLTVLERLMCQGLLPQETNFTTLKLMRVARENLSFTNEEVKTLNFKVSDGKTQWNPVADREVGEVEIELGEVATEEIKKALKKLNEENKLTNDHFSLYEKFVEGGN